MASTKTKAKVTPAAIADKIVADTTKRRAAKKPAVKKVARSGSVSGAAKPAVVNDPAVLATVCSAPRKAPAKKVAAKKSVAAKSHKPVSPSATPALNSSTPSAVSSVPTSAKQERNVNTASPISDKKLMREIMNGIVEADKREADNAKFLDLVVSMVAIATGRFFGVSTYQRLIHAALGSEQIKARKPLFTGLPDAIAREKALAATPKIQNSGISGAHAPASAPLFKKTADTTLASAQDGGKPEAIAAAISRASAALNGTDTISRAHISRVLRRQIEGSSVNVVTQVNGEHLAHVMTDAFTRAEETLKDFPASQRSALRPFVNFFERFWGVIENRIELEHVFNDATFKNFLDSYAAKHLTHGEYARFAFACGARAIVHHTFAGSAMMTIAPNEFVAQLKRRPFADKKAVAEQADRNPPVFTFASSVPQGLSALVRCDVDMPGLSLLVLNRVFGDPVDYALHLGETCLATNIESLLDYLVDKEASVLRRAA